jgi:hypothetical protein
LLQSIPTGVHVLPDLLGCVDKLLYADHDVKDRENFQELKQQVYMERRGINVTEIPILEHKQWIT